MDTGLTALDEDDVKKHLATAQSLVTRLIVMESSESRSSTEIAGTGRRFVSTVSAGEVWRTREVELTKTIQAVR
ncbi:MAG TPA: AAA family ATPase, partial [Rhizobiaceae bacterium]|nr:AAA family ATPase [Rhizobiaceae bacterium]